MMTDNINIFFLFGAGLASVLSPCVLPILPIVVTGRVEEGRLRPLLIVAGLTSAFIIMGILSSLFGSAIGSKIFYIEKIAAVIIVLSGALLMADINIFKHLSFLSGFAQNSRGTFGGFLLGATLGIIWIPE
jgi:cytochrome c-type biogenesis protein